MPSRDVAESRQRVDEGGRSRTTSVCALETSSTSGRSLQGFPDPADPSTAVSSDFQSFTDLVVQAASNSPRVLGGNGLLARLQQKQYGGKERTDRNAKQAMQDRNKQLYRNEKLLNWKIFIDMRDAGELAPEEQAEWVRKLQRSIYVVQRAMRQALVRKELKALKAMLNDEHRPVLIQNPWGWQLENDPWKEQIKLASRRLQRLQETEANYASDDCSSLASSYYSPSEDSTSDDSSESSEAESGGSTSRSPGPETGRGTRKGGRALGRRQASKKRHARRDPLAFQLQGGGQETVLPDAGGTAEGAGSRTTDHPVKRSRQLSLTGQDKTSWFSQRNPNRHGGNKRKAKSTRLSLREEALSLKSFPRKGSDGTSGKWKHLPVDRSGLSGSLARDTSDGSEYGPTRQEEAASLAVVGTSPAKRPHRDMSLQRSLLVSYSVKKTRGAIASIVDEIGRLARGDGGEPGVIRAAAISKWRLAVLKHSLRSFLAKDVKAAAHVEGLDAAVLEEMMAFGVQDLQEIQHLVAGGAEPRGDKNKLKDGGRRLQHLMQLLDGVSKQVDTFVNHLKRTRHPGPERGTRRLAPLPLGYRRHAVIEESEDKQGIPLETPQEPHKVRLPPLSRALSARLRTRPAAAVEDTDARMRTPGSSLLSDDEGPGAGPTDDRGSALSFGLRVTRFRPNLPVSASIDRSASRLALQPSPRIALEVLLLGRQPLQVHAAQQARAACQQEQQGPPQRSPNSEKQLGGAKQAGAQGHASRAAAPFAVGGIGPVCRVGNISRFAEAAESNIAARMERAQRLDLDASLDAILLQRGQRPRFQPLQTAR